MSKSGSVWQSARLEELLVSKRDLTYGIVQPGGAVHDGVPIVRVRDVRNGMVNTSAPLRVAPEIERTYERSRLSGGELLVTLVGTVGETAVAGPELTGWNVARAVAVARIRPDVGARWVSWGMEMSASAGLIAQRVNTTVQTTLNLADLRDVPIPLPPQSERRAIAGALGALDDKIESNRRLVGILVQRVDAELNARFGNRQLALPLGHLADVVDCLHSKKPDRVPEGQRLIQLNNIREDGLIDRSEYFAITGADYVKWSRKFETKAWDLVITNVGRIGAVGRIPGGFVAALGRNMTGIRPNDPECDGPFIAAALLSSAVRREIELRTDAGTIMNALNVRSIPHLRIQASSADERAQFSKFATPLLERADQALEESQQLVAVRNELLPGLLSGRIRLPESACVVQDVLRREGVTRGVPDAAL